MQIVGVNGVSSCPFVVAPVVSPVLPASRLIAPKLRPRDVMSRLFAPAPAYRYSQTLRSRFRQFTPSRGLLYRFYRHATRPPDLALDSSFASSATLPATPDISWGANSTWFVSMTVDNGVAESGFAPVGPSGETFLMLEIVGGEVLPAAPAAPFNVSVAQVASTAGNAFARLLASWTPRTQTNDPHYWAIDWDDGMSEPAGGAVGQYARQIGTAGSVARLNWLIESNIANGTTRNFVVQVRRQSPTAGAIYSPAVRVSATIDAASPAFGEIQQFTQRATES